MKRAQPSDESSMRRAAAIAGVRPNTVARWVKSGRLRCRRKVQGHLVLKLVRVAAVVDLAAKIRTGRPPKGGREDR